MMKIHSIFWIPLLMIIIHGSKANGECQLLINEVNFDNPDVPEFNEFIEFKKKGCTVQQSANLLQSYMAILVKEYEESSNSPVIVLTVDFQKLKFVWSSDFLVIGSPNKKLNPSINFGNEIIVYSGKLFKTRVGVDLGLFKNVNEAPVFMKNFIDNGNKFVMGLIILKIPKTENGIHQL